LHRHFIINKPAGYLSQFVNNQTKRKNKKLLGELHEFPNGIMAIGRLDQSSEGLLLLTTDGKVSAIIRDRSVEKEYFAQVDGLINNEAIEKLKKGVEIRVESGMYKTLPCKCFKVIDPPQFKSTKKIRDERHGPTSWISITLSEGKFRQVRKMTAAVGFPTLRLVRIRIGNIELNNMDPGSVIEVDQFDV